jgi:hypothetical protein
MFLNVINCFIGKIAIKQFFVWFMGDKLSKGNLF